MESEGGGVPGEEEGAGTAPLGAAGWATSAGETAATSERTGAEAPPTAELEPAEPSDDGTRRGWVKVVLIAALVGGLVGAGVGAGVASAIRSGSTTVISFSPNTSVFKRMGDIQSVLARVLPSVVAIRASGPACASLPLGATSEVDEGTGMIISPSGEILTNNHVIANATQIRVTLYGHTTEYPATLIGTDPTYDVAVLQLHGVDHLPTVSLGDSSRTQVGDDVLAIGNALALSQSTPSVTEGIISAEGRSINAGGDDCVGTESLTGLLQTQAPINPGNSGGPLVDSAGQVIGMNTAAATSSAGNAPAQNIGFAIPVDSIKTLLPGLRKGGTIGPPKAFIGVEVVSVTPAQRSAYGLTPAVGALVVSVVTGAPAAQAGIRPDDVIVGFNGRVITTDASLTLAVRAAHPGERVTVQLYRGAKRITVLLVLGTKPAPESGTG